MNKAQLAKLESFIHETIDKYLELNEVCTMSGGGAGAAFDAPDAFSGESEEAHAKRMRKKFQYSGREIVKEISYRDFKKDETRSPRQKINTAILEVNRNLRMINRIFDHATKLKVETQVGDDQYWKRTVEAMNKIHERLGLATQKFQSVFESVSKLQESEPTDSSQVKVGSHIKHNTSGAIMKVDSMNGPNLTCSVVEPGDFSKTTMPKMKLKIGQKQKTNSGLIGKTYTLVK